MSRTQPGPSRRRSARRLARNLSLALGLAAGGLACGGAPELAPVDRSALPAPAPTKAFHLPEVQTFTLSNGLKVLHIELTHTPLLTLQLRLPHGASSEPNELAGLSALMIDLLDEGAGDYDALQLANAFQHIATDYHAGTGLDLVQFTMHMIADQLDASLALFSQILLKPHFSEAEFERRKQHRTAGVLQALVDPSYIADLLQRRLLYGEGYMGQPVRGSQQSLEGLTLEAVQARYEALVKPEGAAVIAVGAVDAETLRATLEKHLSAWQGAPSVEVKAVRPEVPSRRIALVDLPGSSQSELSVIRRTEGSLAGEHFEALLFNRCLGGAFTSRLNLNLREDKGYTYGARSASSRWNHAGIYHLGARVQAEVTRASLDEMFKELSEIGEARPISEKEHQESQDGLLKSFPANFETMNSIADQLGRNFSKGRDYSWLKRWPERVAEVSLEAAQTQAKAHAQLEDYSVVVVGDLASVAPTLVDLGIPMVLYSPQGQEIGPYTPPAKAAGTGRKVLPKKGEAAEGETAPTEGEAAPTEGEAAP